MCCTLSAGFGAVSTSCACSQISSGISDGGSPNKSQKDHRSHTAALPGTQFHPQVQLNKMLFGGLHDMPRNETVAGTCKAAGAAVRKHSRPRAWAHTLINPNPHSTAN